MKNLVIHPTPTTPFILGNFSNGDICIIGKSTPDKIVDIAKPLEEWIREFIELSDKALTLYIDLCYYDTPTSLTLTGIFSMINRQQGNKQSEVYWYYYSDDDDMMENGEDYKVMSKFPFALIENEKPITVNIKKTDISPLIYLDDTGDFIIQGVSNTDEPLLFYRPIIRWLSEELIIPTLRNISLEICLHNIASGNIPFVQAIIHLVDALHQNGTKTSIQWNYADKETEELGIQILTNLTSHYVFKHLTNREYQQNK